MSDEDEGPRCDGRGLAEGAGRMSDDEESDGTSPRTDASRTSGRRKAPCGVRAAAPGAPAAPPTGTRRSGA